MAALAIGVDWGDGAIRGIRIRGERPQPGRALTGLRAPEVLALLSRLYAICGRAQCACAELALAAAADGRPSATRPAELATLALAEAVQEHLWRLLLDWPRALALAPLSGEFRRWYGRVAAREPGWPAALLAELERDWLGIPPLAIEGFADLRAFDAWQAAGDGAAALLFQRLRGERAAAATPQCRALLAGESACTLAAHAGHPLIAALLAAGRGLEAHVAARLVGLLMATAALDAGAVTELAMDAESPAAGHGRAVIATARGLLEHEVVLTDGRVGRYDIRTPTDANFAPDGPFVRRLCGQAAPSAADAMRVAALWTLAFDPCVSYEVAVTGPAHA